MRDPGVLLASGFLATLYLAALMAMPPGVFYSPDEGTKYLQLLSIGWRGGLAYEIPYGGTALDPDYAFYPTHCRHEDLYPVQAADGGVKLHWPIWFSLVTKPPVSLFGLRGLYLVPLLSGWLVALVSGRLACLYDRRLAPAAILTVGLATPLAFFSLTYWEHTLATLLALAALALVAERERHRAARRVAAALLLAAVVLRIELASFAIAIALAWLVARHATAPVAADGRGRAPAWIAALAGGAAIAAVACLAATGLLPARHLWLLRELPTYVVEATTRLPHVPGALVALLIDAPGTSAPDLPMWLRGGALLAFAAAAAAPFVRSPRPATAVGLAATFAALGFSLLLAVHPAPYMSLHGLLPVAPFVVLAAWALPDAWRCRRFDRLFLASAAGLYLLLGVTVLFTFAVDASGAYRTGLEWGNRYLLTFYPLASVLALAGIHTWRRVTDGGQRQVATALAVGLFLCGLQMEMRGLWVLFRSRSLISEWQAALGTDAPVVTDIWWLPAAMAPYFATHPMYCVRDRGDLASWMAMAHGRGAEAFSLASFRDIEAPALDAAPLVVTETGREPVSGLRVTRYRFDDRN
jgi:hypothetical protein